MGRDIRNDIQSQSKRICDCTDEIKTTKPNQTKSNKHNI